MIDNKQDKGFRNFGINRVLISQFKEFNCEEELTPIQTRMYFLMINGSMPRSVDESLYGWCGRLGLSNSTIFGIFKKNNKNMHLSVANKISKATGANIDWIQKGIGEPFETDIKKEPDISGVASDAAHILDAALLQEAFDTLEQALKATGRVMQPKGVSRFVATVYASLKEDEEMDTEVLQDCILTVEEALKSTRRHMSPKAKTDLILAIYELYSGNASYKEAMTSTINQLIRSVS